MGTENQSAVIGAERREGLSHGAARDVGGRSWLCSRQGLVTAA